MAIRNPFIGSYKRPRAIGGLTVPKKPAAQVAIVIKGWEENSRKVEKFLSMKLKRIGLRLVITENVGSSHEWHAAFESRYDRKLPAFVGFKEKIGNYCLNLSAMDNLAAPTEEALWSIELPNFFAKHPIVVYEKRREDPKTEVVHREVVSENFFAFDLNECTSWSEIMLKETVANG